MTLNASLSQAPITMAPTRAQTTLQLCAKVQNPEYKLSKNLIYWYSMSNITYTNRCNVKLTMNRPIPRSRATIVHNYLPFSLNRYF